jgi:hypothetical protein
MSYQSHKTKDFTVGLRGIILWDYFVRHLYRWWRRLQGHNFNPSVKPREMGKCYLATKYVENLYNKVLWSWRGRDCSPTILELYELKCPGWPHHQLTYFQSRLLRNRRCEWCKRALEISEGDKLVE